MASEKYHVILTPALQYVQFYLLCFQVFFFLISEFLLFELDMPRNSFFGIYHTWCFLSSLDLQFGIWHSFGEVLNHYCFKYFFCSFLFSPSGIIFTHMLCFLYLSHSSWIFNSFFFQYFFSLLFSFRSFYWHVLNLTDFFPQPCPTD